MGHLIPQVAPDTAGRPPSEPQAVVETFLAALVAKDLDRASALVDDEILYVNVGLPSVQGRREFTRVLDLLGRPSVGFEVYLHAISADGPTVLTERTDAIVIGSMRVQFWVCGRFDVVDGRITLWRDAFDFLDVMRGSLRGLLGIARPARRPRPPSMLADPPGR